jgi:hypothetical protein
MDTIRRDGDVIGLTIYFFALCVAASLAPIQGVRQRGPMFQGFARSGGITPG